MGIRSFVSSTLVATAFVLASGSANAQVSPVPKRDTTWSTVTNITMVGSAGVALFLPRIFYSDPEVTVGWKTRWHVSLLAPALTMTALATLNEFALKDTFKGDRPDCDASNRGLARCDSYGMLSTHAFGAGSALGVGTGIFLIDTLKWSHGRFNGYSLLGNIATPFVLGAITVLGRGLGNWESTGQIALGGVTGLGFGFLSGITYALMQRPECDYTGSLICW